MKKLLTLAASLIAVIALGQNKPLDMPNRLDGGSTHVNNTPPQHANADKANLYSQGFNGGSLPAGWVIEDVTGTAGELTFVTTSTYPSGFNPTEGTHFIRFNSFSTSGGEETQIKMTTPVSTVGYTNISVDFDWAKDDGYNTKHDSVSVLWSTDGTTWTSAGSVSRVGTADAWTAQSFALPAGASNQAALYICFRFTSLYGNDCHLDNFVLKGNVPVANDLVVYANSLALNSNSGLYFIGQDTLSFTVYNNGTSASAGVNVSVYDGAALLGTVPTGALAVGASVDLQYPFVATVVGNHMFHASVPADDNNANNADTLEVYLMESLTKVFCFRWSTANVAFIDKYYPTMPIDIAAISAPAYGGTWANGQYYIMTNTNELMTVDTLTGTTTTIGATGITGMSFVVGLAYDWTTGAMYTLGLSGSYPDFTPNLYNIDIATGVATLVGTLDVAGTYLDVACDLDGNLYAIRHIPTTPGKLVTLDKTTAAVTQVADFTGIISAYFQEFEYNAEDDNFLWFAYGDAGEISGYYLIDKASAVTTPIGVASGLQIIALAIPYNVTYDVAITVIDSTTSLPIAGAGVAMYTDLGVFVDSLITDAAGLVTFGLADGTYYYSIYASGYSSIMDSSLVIAGLDTAFTIELSESGIGFNENELSRVKLYPSLSDGQLILSADKVVALEVMDVTGNIVFVASYNAGNSEINLTNLSEGIYLVKITTDDASRTDRIVIRK